jgi:hypothetical protein
VKRRRPIALALLALTTSACARTHLPTSFEIRDASGPGLARAGHVAPERTSAGKVAADDAAGSLDDQATLDGGVVKPVVAIVEAGADAAAGAPQADSAVGDTAEVWIGELWSVSSGGLCDPSAPWTSAPLMAQPMGYVNRAVLILEHPVDQGLRGRIQLGEGALPDSPGEVNFSGGTDSSSHWLCSIQLPTKGMEYTLRDPLRTSDRLMFEISASDVWNGYCAKQAAPCSGLSDAGCPPPSAASDAVCTCKNGSCKAVEYVLVAFDLAVTADTLEGELPSLGGGFGTPAELRLRRVGL